MFFTSNMMAHLVRWSLALFDADMWSRKTFFMNLWL